MGLLEEMIKNGIAFKVNNKRDETRALLILNTYSLKWLNDKEALHYAPSDDHDNFDFPYWITSPRGTNIMWTNNEKEISRNQYVIMDMNEPFPEELDIYMCYRNFHNVSRDLIDIKNKPYSNFDSYALAAINSLRITYGNNQPYEILLEFIEELKKCMSKK